MFGLPSLQSMLISAAVAAIIAGVGVGWTVHKIDSASYEKLQLADAQASQKAMEANQKAIATAAAEQKKQDDASAEIELASIQSQNKIVTKTVTLTKEIPIYVTPAQDAAFGTLPCGFVSLHDAAADGEDQSASTGSGPDNSSVAPDSGCKTSVALSQALSIIVANYGEYHAVADRLTKWQVWGATVVASLDKYNETLAQSAR